MKKVVYELLLYPETKADSNGLVLFTEPDIIDYEKGILQKRINYDQTNPCDTFNCYHIRVHKWYCESEDHDTLYPEYDYENKVWIDDTLDSGKLPKYIMDELNKTKFPEGTLQKYPKEYLSDEWSDSYEYDKKSNTWNWKS